MSRQSQQWPPGGDIAASAISAHPWEASSLGPVDRWPQSLRSSLDLVLSLETAAAVLWGPELTVLPNAAFARLAGEAAPLLGKSAGRTWPAGWPGSADLWDRVRGGESMALTASAEGPALAFSPLRDESGCVAGILVAATAPGRAGQHAWEPEGGQHETRNALAWTRSIARRTAMTSMDVDDYLMHLDGRIDAYSRARLAAAVAPEGVSLAAVVAAELLAVAVQEDERASLEGPEVALRPKAVESLSLAIHELATNAVKFGALASRHGRIAVRWHIDEGGGGRRLVLEWKETGAPEPVELARRGFGMEVIERSLPYELGATTRITFEPDGIRCLVEADLEVVAIV